jgi:membrane-associated protease RseP (regulator of RpoE activity)
MQGLSPEDRKGFPEIDLTNRQHRAYVATIYKGHEKGSAKDFEKFYEAQCLWDEGMAESLSEFLKSPQAEGRTVLVFAGSGHIVFGFGIPKRFHRRTPSPYQTIVLKTWSEKLNGDLTSAKASSPLANFLWITKPNPPEKKRPRIGVILKTNEDLKGLVIEKVLPGSPAEKAGLVPGDQLIAVEGIEIREVKEIHHALSEKGWGNDITFTIYREGKQKEITVQLPPLED